MITEYQVFDWDHDAYVVDADNNLNTINDRRLFVRKSIGSIGEKVDEGRVSTPRYGRLNGKDRLFWYADNAKEKNPNTKEAKLNSIVRVLEDIDNPNSGKTTIGNPEYKISEPFVLVKNQKNEVRGIIWEATDFNDNEQGAYALSFDGKDWGKPITIDTSKESVHKPTALAYANNDRSVAYTKHMGKKDKSDVPTDLIAAVIPYKTEFEARKAWTTVEHRLPGQAHGTVQIYNNGLAPSEEGIDIESYIFNDPKEKNGSYKTPMSQDSKVKVLSGEWAYQTFPLRLVERKESDIPVNKHNYRVCVAPHKGKPIDKGCAAVTTGIPNIQMIAAKVRRTNGRHQVRVYVAAINTVERKGVKITAYSAKTNKPAANVQPKIVNLIAAPSEPYKDVIVTYADFTLDYNYEARNHFPYYFVLTVPGADHPSANSFLLIPSPTETEANLDAGIGAATGKNDEAFEVVGIVRNNYPSAVSADVHVDVLYKGEIEQTRTFDVEMPAYGSTPVRTTFENLKHAPKDYQVRIYGNDPALFDNQEQTKEALTALMTPQKKAKKGKKIVVNENTELAEAMKAQSKTMTDLLVDVERTLKVSLSPDQEEELAKDDKDFDDLYREVMRAKAIAVNVLDD